MSIKRELREARAELKDLQGQHEVVRFQLMWRKILRLAEQSRDLELLEDIGWFLAKTKFYTDRHARDNRAQDKARRAKAKISDADYDRLAPTAANDKALATALGVHPTTLSRYKAKRFPTIS